MQGIGRHMTHKIHVYKTAVRTNFSSSANTFFQLCSFARCNSSHVPLNVWSWFVISWTLYEYIRLVFHDCRYVWFHYSVITFQVNMLCSGGSHSALELFDSNGDCLVHCDGPLLALPVSFLFRVYMLGTPGEIFDISWFAPKRLSSCPGTNKAQHLLSRFCFMWAIYFSTHCHDPVGSFVTKHDELFLSLVARIESTIRHGLCAVSAKLFHLSQMSCYACMSWLAFATIACESWM